MRAPHSRSQAAILCGIDVSAAEQIARVAHAGQTDKAGLDYVDSHVADVVARLEAAGHRPEVVAAGWLHDVLEDTAVTDAELVAGGIPDVVVAAVIALTRSAGQTPDAYYAQVRANPVALAVKVDGDIPSNSDPDRLALLDEATAHRLARKYAAALTKLTGPAD